MVEGDGEGSRIAAAIRRPRLRNDRKSADKSGDFYDNAFDAGAPSRTGAGMS
jgi:hypothetical protein